MQKAVDPVTRGRRIACARRRRNLSQAALAGLVGRSESWLSQVERGRREIDNYSVLVRLANILRIDLQELTGDDLAGLTSSRYRERPRIEHAMLRYDAFDTVISSPAAERPADFPRLRLEVAQVQRLYQATRYDEAGRMLVRLIRGVETTTRTCPHSERRTANILRAQAYQAAATVLTRVGEPHLAQLAGDRALSAAEHAESGTLVTVSAYRLGHVALRLRRPDQAKDIVLRAAGALAPAMRDPSPPQLSLWGALHLVAAMAAAAELDRAETARHLAQARLAAERLGVDRNDHWSAFGPTNVRIHEISAAVALGDPRTAVRLGERLDLSLLPPELLGRRCQVRLDLARSYTVLRKDAAAVNTLLEAERISHQLVRYDGRTHELLQELLRREHRASTPELRPLARRAGVV